MRRALALAALLACPTLLSGQPTGALRITVTLPDEAQKPTAVSRYALLISDNPPTTIPRRVFTGPDGAVTVPLLPGSYIVESDRPVTAAGKAYEWTQLINVAAGGTVTLALTAENADISPAAPNAAAETAASSSDPSFLAGKWLNSVVAVWSPTARATGFLLDARGLIATHGGVSGPSSPIVAVQVSPDLKVHARVLYSSPAREIAILSVDPSVIAGRTPVPLDCPAPTAATLAEGQEIVALTAPFGKVADVSDGEITGSTPWAIDTDLRLGFGGAGGPVFNAAGAVAGVTSPRASPDRRGADDITIVRAGILCPALAAAQPRLSAGSPPRPIPLPIEPPRQEPEGEINNASSVRTPPVVSSSDFDVAIITPLFIQQARQNDRTGGRSGRSPEAETRLGRLTEFGAWSDYFGDPPPVVIVRVTPKLVEGFWKRLAREAARTQGAELPPFKDFTTSFASMRASCGSADVMPVQPFVLEHRVSEAKVVREGLYVFDPVAFAPPCARVTLSIHAEKASEKGDTVTIDAALLRNPRVP